METFFKILKIGRRSNLQIYILEDRMNDVLRDGSKFIGYPSRDHRQGGDDFYVGSSDSDAIIGV